MMLGLSLKLKKYKAKDFKTSRDKTYFLGEGGFGAARLCRHKELGTVVAKCSFITGQSSEIASRKDSFKREANVLCRICHENIVTLIGITTWFNNAAIILEYVNGGDLHNLLFSKTKVLEIPWNLRLRIAYQTTAGLSYIHNHREMKIVCHGDLKPQNILLTKDLQVKVADFGAATLILAAGASATSIETPHTSVCTDRYVAPEFKQNPRRPRDCAMDMYSFGGVVYELLNRGKRFSPREERNVVKFLTERQLDEDEEIVLLKLWDVMEECLDEEPTRRTTSSTVEADLSQLMGNPKHRVVDLNVEIIANLLYTEKPRLSESQMITLYDLRPPFKGDGGTDEPTEEQTRSSNENGDDPSSSYRTNIKRIFDITASSKSESDDNTGSFPME